MKRIVKKSLPIVLVLAIVASCGSMVSCGSSKSSHGNQGREVMYERSQSNKGSKVNTNIKVRGSNKRNRHTTRTY